MFLIKSVKRILIIFFWLIWLDIILTGGSKISLQNLEYMNLLYALPKIFLRLWRRNRRLPFALLAMKLAVFVNCINNKIVVTQKYHSTAKGSGYLVYFCSFQ